MDSERDRHRVLVLDRVDAAHLRDAIVSAA
jgi:hypothetical protein